MINGDKGIVQIFAKASKYKMQFNLSSKQGYWFHTQEIPSESQVKNNYENAMSKLRSVGLPDIKIIWWQVRPEKVDNFPSTISETGTYHFSGFDGSILTLLLGAESVINDKGEKVQLTAEEMMTIALNQTLMQHITIPE